MRKNGFDEPANQVYTISVRKDGRRNLPEEKEISSFQRMEKEKELLYLALEMD